MGIGGGVKGSGVTAPAGAVLAALLAVLAACSAPERLEGGAAWRRRGAEAEVAGHPDSALVTYREAARRYPTEAWPWAGVGRSCAALGRFGDAEDAFRTAVRWDSSVVAERAALAGLALDDGRPKEALDWLDSAAARAAEDVSRAALRARALAAAGRGGEARAVVGRARAVAPEDPEVLGAAALVRAADGDTESALAGLDEACALHPRDAGLREVRATVLLAAGDSAAAMDALQAALELDERRPRARRRLVELLRRAGRAGEAEPHLRRLLTDDPFDVVALNALSATARARGDEEAAAAALQRAIGIDPEFAPAYLALGKLEADAGHGDEAVTLLRKARARALDDAELWSECSVALAELYVRLGEGANAYEIADAMLERDPESVAGRELRAAALARGGAGAASGEELERLALDPAALPAELRARSRWLLDHGSAAKALASLDPLVAAHPEDVEARVLRAEALLASGQKDPARWALTSLVTDGVAPAAAYRMLAGLLLEDGRLEEAQQRAAEGEALAPDDPAFAHLRGEAAARLGDPESARVAFLRERDLAPDRPDPWRALGELELADGRPEDALPWFAQAGILDPSDWRPLHGVARAEAARGRTAEAVAALRDALALREDVAPLHATLARVLADAGGPRDEVAAHAARAIQLDPRDTASRELLRRARR